jgi:hypothetical protein
MLSRRTVPEKVSEFLSRCTGRRYCDSCIQERLGLKWRQQVQLVTATLAVTRSFAREFGQCCTCNEQKQVIFATEDVGLGIEPSRSRFLKPVLGITPSN